ncbi:MULTISPECIES: DUF2141 domain-containing protein [unclassified Sphingomonas]|uniref:DUF2141 domain-containing protein n=1 Tax=unclassified Sphingomonas TaxID=196159 RepID=UPI000BDBEFF0|nr:MAG: hypothetical protein B7Z43_08195 [Sphingomonas sp. 12-62-6]OYX37084.1 MAG: hypothetical protein B7Y98_13595 [Sphingomonas sp. 32-62-10]
MRVVVAFGVLASLLSASPAFAGDLTVKVTGVKAKGGHLLVAVYDKATLFRAKPPFAGEAKASAAGDMTVTIKDVAAGDYVVSVLHDADDDKKMTMTDGRFGEGTALTNAEQLRGPPSFEVNKIAIPASGTVVTIAMSYPEDRSGW